MPERRPLDPRSIEIPNLLTEQEVSTLTRIPVRTLQDWRYRAPKHTLPYTRVGGRILYREDVLMAWLEENTTYE
ncbi:helix-turn-helix domain-containing protein [Microbacterium gubbeenense]|uniref:helix-turn-helix domain-containing protein n=1 Tax=Microbacterium gubbeenense TaxID=159896 RepID=UPI003F9BD18B